jgi:prepilin-type N-terminal cleavage/methylation domain-containing protein
MRFQKGFSLVEVMVSMVILLVGLISITGQWPAGTKMVMVSGQASFASVIAERFLEQLEGLDFPSAAGMGSGSRPISGHYGANYQLAYTVAPGPIPNTAVANVVVSWMYLGQPHAVRMSTIIAAEL